MAFQDRFKQETISDYYKWFNRNRIAMENLSINERINKFLRNEKNEK